MLAGSLRQESGRFATETNHLTNRSEPADTELGSQRRNTIPCSIRTGTGGTETDQERGDGGVELCCHRLHPPLVQMVSCGASVVVVLQEADGRGVALERLIREGINLERQINMVKEMERARQLVGDRELCDRPRRI